MQGTIAAVASHGTGKVMLVSLAHAFCLDLRPCFRVIL
jgi:hypothetical protein